MKDPRVRLLFGKARVRPHVRGKPTPVTVAAYDTTRPPGRTAGELVFRVGLPDIEEVKKSRKAQVVQHRLKELLQPVTPTSFAAVKEVHTGTPGYAFAVLQKGQVPGRQYLKAVRSAVKKVVAEQGLHHTVDLDRAYGVVIFHIWESPGVASQPQERGTLLKAIGRLDSFLRARWSQAKGFFKGKAEETLGAGKAGPLPVLALDTASAQDIGEEDQENQGDGLPWADDAHASAPPLDNEPDSVDVLDPLAKAYAIQEDLQKSIETIDAQLAGQLQDQDREALLSAHLDYLIRADALSGRITVAERFKGGAT